MSALNERDLAKLCEKIEDMLLGQRCRLRLPISRGDLASLAYRIGEVTESETEDDWMLLTLRLNAADMEKWGWQLEPYRIE